METPAHFSFNRAHGPIRKLSLGLSIQSHSNRKTGVFLPDDLNASDGFTPGPTSDGVHALFSQGSVAKALCNRFRHASYLARTRCE
jgi:hypothetical protein